ncbi:MAG: PQQ-binding-like beta-propeller repeat protein [ANME-2 cluster archaeon]|nr:PQQ-binding-like beta-propeller repeat protein [ANME-2 cluster archaeon]
MCREISIYVLVSMMCIACAASAIAQTAPFVISGYIFNSDGSPCNGPDIIITDLTTGVNQTALVHSTSNYYRLVLDSSSISTGDILHFHISCSSQSQTIEHTITGSHIDNGGITNSNFTFTSNGINLSGYKINDTNGNGLWNPGEQGIQGWNITLKNATSVVVSTASTNQQGYYEFTNLLPGSYNVSEEDKAGWMHTNASFKQVTLADKYLTNLNFTNRPFTHAVPELDTLFVISGWTHYEDNTEYNNPVISITNLHTSDNWHPMTRSGNNYYRLILNTTDISSGDVLQFNFTDGESINLTDHTITPDDINCGGLSDFNLTSRTRAIPDIAVEVEMPEYMYPDYPDDIYITVKNTGIRDIDLFNLSFDVNETLVDTITISSLPAGENTAVHFTWTPADTGNYAVSITADLENQLNELNRDNNKITKNVNVTPLSVIHVPNDYSTIQDAIDHAGPHTFIFLRDGEHWLSTGDQYSPITIDDKHHLKLIGSSKCAKIMIRTAFINKPGLDMIRIFNSSQIELRRFTAEATGINENTSLQNIRLVAVERSNNIKLTDLILHHDGHTEDAPNNAIKLVNSEYCRIVSNVLSGKEKRYLTEPIGTVGISLVNSRNNLISNNTIYHFVQCINLADNNTLNNTLHLNNLFPHENGGIAAIDHGCNHWNSAASMKYLYNASEYRNYTGNYWNGFTSNDSNGDGIADSPYTSGRINDHYPMIEPHGLTFNLITTGISRPSLIYTGRENRILASIEREGTYPESERLEVKLTVNDIEVESKVITMKNRENRILRFIWVPGDVGAYNLTVDVHPENEMREVDETDNKLSINVTVSSPMFNYTDNIISALDFLNRSQMPRSGSLSGFSNSAWAALGITAVGEDPASGGWKPCGNSLIDYLRNEPKDSVTGLSPGTNPCDLTTIEDFTRMIFVISAIGEDPTNFGDVNYLLMLKSFYDGEQFGTPDIVEDDALAILALVSCGDKDTRMISNAASNITDQQKEDGRWISPYGNSDVKTTSFVIQALIAAGESRNSLVITNALDYLKTEQEDDGGFSDARTTSYAIQAIVAAGQDPLTYLSNGKSPLDYLMDLQQDDGSFNKTLNMSMYPVVTTTYSIPALYGAIHPVMIKTTREDYKMPDISIVDIVIEDETFVNTTTILTIYLKNNGGIFDVALFSDGGPIGNQSVRSVWSDSITPVSFTWKPDKNETHNLTFVVDAGDQIRELYENNNRLTHEINVLRPDLYPFVITQPPHTFVNVTNDMTLTINGTNDEYFNVTLTVDGVILLNRMITGIKNNLVLSVSWRPSAIGEHTLELVVDPGEDMLESNEENNVLTKVVNVENPDLVPAAFETIPIYVNATNKVILSVEGTAEYFNVSLIENGTGVSKTSGIICYGSTDATVLWKPHVLGNCTLQAVVDCDNDIEETNEDNNNISQDFTVVLPDIIPKQITPYVIFLNETNRITIDVNGTAEVFNASMFANNILIDKKTELDTYNSSIWFDWTPDTNGTYNLTVYLDPDNDVAETNETNNNLTAGIIAANRIDLELFSPLGGEIWTGIQNIAWNATYEEPVSIDLLYSANLGHSWNAIATNITNNGSYMWDTSYAIDGKYQVKVIARWGAVTEVDRSDLFYVYNKNSASEWGEFHSNAGFSLSDAPDTNEIAWMSEDIGAEGSSSLIVADGKIFVYCAGWNQLYSDYTYLVALNESDGKVLWGTPIAPREYGSWATPTYHKGKIYISSGNGVYCIDATKEDRGPVLWTFRFPDGGGSVNGGPAVADGKVYVGSWGGGHYYCLDAGNGTEIWRFEIVENSQSVPAVAYGRAYFGDFRYPDERSKVYSIDMNDAYEFWSTTVDWNVCGSVTVSDGVIYFTTYNFNGLGMLYALDAGNGTEVWKNSIITTDSTPAFYAPSGSTRSYVYISSGFGEHVIYCFDVKNGELIWKNEKDKLGSWTNSPAVSADKKVFVGKEGTGMVPGYAGLYCLNAFTGDVLWHSDYGGSSPAIANGMVYTIGVGRVIAFGSTILPDLTVERIYVPEKINAGKTLVITVQINNIGESSVNESFGVALTHKGRQIDKITVPSLDIGDVTNVSFNWTPQQTGNHRLMVTVDADKTVTESDPMNNWCTVDVIVGDHQSDLTVTAIDAPYVNRVGMNINITVHIENIGSETNNTFDVGLMINNRLEDNETTSMQNNDGTDNDNNNDIDNRTSVGFNWTLDATGTYSLTGTVNLDDDVNKTNNNMTIEIEVVTNETFFGYGPGHGGGSGGGTSDGIGSGDGTGESSEAGAGGMEYSGDTSSSVKDRISEITGFLFGDASSGSSGGGGALPAAFIICLIFILGLLYHGHRSEKRSLIDEKHHLMLPRGFRRKKS